MSVLKRTFFFSERERDGDDAAAGSLHTDDVFNDGRFDAVLRLRVDTFEILVVSSLTHQLSERTAIARLQRHVWLDGAPDFCKRIERSL